MSETFREAQCQKCGERVAVEDGIAEPCGCDPVCSRCGKHFKTWVLDSDPIRDKRDGFCSDCFKTYRDEYIKTHELKALWSCLTFEGFSPGTKPVTGSWEKGYMDGLKQARFALEYHIYCEVWWGR